MVPKKEKIIVYQLLPRLFGNTKKFIRAWGTKEENGIGKFSDISMRALDGLKKLGVTHIWLTGVLHNALIGDYKEFGISDDDPDVVKGRAGSPYAIKDYYSVNPDLAIDPSRRNEEFRELVEKIHQNEMKVIIDIVPNHVARKYESLLKPEGVEDLGAGDDKSLEYHRDNNFYYIPEKSFEVPDFPADHLPLGGEQHPLSDRIFNEFPAKWTGNGSRSSKPALTDWYETVKLNYGIRPDGSWDFEFHAEEIESQNPSGHFDYWQNKSVPNTWSKMKDIAIFWQEMGVDGFRYDMAEMVPVAFWSYLNAHLKHSDPSFLTIAEIYQPALYHDFISLGFMDFLYDKVGLYDTLRAIIQEQTDCHQIFPAFDPNYSISDHLLHFLENHDEHRIASSFFAGKAEYAKPGMILSATIGKGSLLIYNGQEVGEDAIENSGFGSEGRSSIFDYTALPKHQKWMNDGAFDGKLLSEKELELREFYKNMIRIVRENKAFSGNYYDLHRFNSENSNSYPGHKVYAFARWKEMDRVLILCNFDKHSSYSFRFKLYPDLVNLWSLDERKHAFTEQFTSKRFTLNISEGQAFMDLNLSPLESLILKYTSIQ